MLYLYVHVYIFSFALCNSCVRGVLMFYNKILERCDIISFDKPM